MGRRMANSSIVQLTFTHRRGENRLPSQVLTLILIHIKPTMPHRRGVPPGHWLRHCWHESAASHIKEHDCATSAFRSSSWHGLAKKKVWVEKRLLKPGSKTLSTALLNTQWKAQCLSSRLVEAVRVAYWSGCNDSSQRGQLLAATEVIISPQSERWTLPVNSSVC